MSVDLEALAKLREPFPPEAISKLPKGKEDKAKRQSCRVCKGYHDPSMFHLDYVGHAALTDRLLNVDPEWNWEPFATDEHGAPLMERTQQGAPVGLWIRLTVAGMTRPGYGSVEGAKPEAVKELIGDALRNAAMRFGCALDLWHKGELPGQDEQAGVPSVAEMAEDVEQEHANLIDRVTSLLDDCELHSVEVDRAKAKNFAATSIANANKAIADLSARLEKAVAA